MAKRNFGIGVLAIVLVFGMAVIGCDNDLTNGGTDPALNGTWGLIFEEWEEEILITFNNGNFEQLVFSAERQKGGMRGTFTTNNGVLTMRLTHVFMCRYEAEWIYRETGVQLEERFFTGAELISALGVDLVTIGNYYIRIQIDGSGKSWHGGSQNYVVSGNTLTISMEWEGDDGIEIYSVVFTRR